MPDKRKPRPPKAKAKIRGEAEDWTDDEIDKLAEVTEDDVRAAGADWRRKAPRRARRLLDAREVDDEQGGN